ncbi:hypothetical protein ACFOMH_18650, partial [Paracoccus mangrovi]
DTARLDDDARHARRLAIDRQTQGCVADETNRKGVGPGVSRACPVDPLARLQIILDRAQARASPGFSSAVRKMCMGPVDHRLTLDP